MQCPPPMLWPAMPTTRTRRCWPASCRVRSAAGAAALPLLVQAVLWGAGAGTRGVCACWLLGQRPNRAALPAAPRCRGGQDADAVTHPPARQVAPPPVAPGQDCAAAGHPQARSLQSGLSVAVLRCVCCLGAGWGSPWVVPPKRTARRVLRPRPCCASWHACCSCCARLRGLTANCTVRRLCAPAAPPSAGPRSRLPRIKQLQQRARPAGSSESRGPSSRASSGSGSGSEPRQQATQAGWRSSPERGA